METKDIIKLIDAGFTVDEIRAMLTPAAKASEPGPEKDPAPAAAPEPEKAPEPAQAVKDPDPAPEKKEQDPYKETFDAIEKQIAEITANVNKITKLAFMPSMEDVKPLGIDDVITKFFKEV